VARPAILKDEANVLSDTLMGWAPVIGVNAG
jgi:hypothetical protein